MDSIWPYDLFSLHDSTITPILLPTRMRKLSNKSILLLNQDYYGDECGLYIHIKSHVQPVQSFTLDMVELIATLWTH